MDITPEEEFWGHCSNLQAWVENNYDTRLLHSNIAFPLLKKLTEAGDPNTNKVFKEEIARRFESGFMPVIELDDNSRAISFMEQALTIYEKLGMDHKVEEVQKSIENL